MYQYPFEKLEVWQLSKKFVVKVYAVTQNFPVEEKFGMVNQMRRAAVSICSNLAEGSGRNTAKDQAHFYGMAYSSFLELLNQILISVELNWINATHLEELRQDVQGISARINSLRNATMQKQTNNQ